MESYICKECGEKAEYITVDDEVREYKPLCQECLEELEDEEDFVITITNSPRMGVCGYSGDNDTYGVDMEK